MKLSVVPQLLHLPLHLLAVDLHWQAEQTIDLSALNPCRQSLRAQLFLDTCSHTKEQHNPYTHLCVQTGEYLPTASVAFEVSLLWSGSGEFEYSVIVQLKMEHQNE